MNIRDKTSFCPYRVGIICGKQECFTTRCGWHPSEEKRRKNSVLVADKDGIRRLKAKK